MVNSTKIPVICKKCGRAASVTGEYAAGYTCSTCKKEKRASIRVNTKYPNKGKLVSTYAA